MGRHRCGVRRGGRFRGSSLRFNSRQQACDLAAEQPGDAGELGDGEAALTELVASDGHRGAP